MLVVEEEGWWAKVEGVGHVEEGGADEGRQAEGKSAEEATEVASAAQEVVAELDTKAGHTVAVG